MNIEKMAKAIEKDARQSLPDLHGSLQQTKDGKIGQIHKLEQILIRAAHKKLGLSQTKFADLIQTPGDGTRLGTRSFYTARWSTMPSTDCA